MGRLKAIVRAKLATAGIDFSAIEGLKETLEEEVINPFEGLETRHKQERFYHEKLGLVVSPYLLKFTMHVYMYRTASMLRSPPFSGEIAV